MPSAGQLRHCRTLNATIPFAPYARHVAAFMELGRYLDPSMGAMDSAQVEEQRQVRTQGRMRQTTG